MKNFTKLLTILLCLSTLLTLSACGGHKPSTTTMEVGGHTIEITTIDYTFQEYITENDQTIWYVFNKDLGKDTQVDRIFVLNADGTMYFSNTDLTLGKLAQMEDKDIAAMVEADYRAQAANKNAGIRLNANREDALFTLHQALFGGDMISIYTTEYHSLDLKTWVMENARSYLGEATYGIQAVEEEWQEIEAVYTAWMELADSILDQDLYYVLLDLLYNISNPEELSYLLNDELSQYPEFSSVVTQANAILSKMDAAANSVYESILTQAEEQQDNIQPARWKLAINTDHTGNNTATEMLAYCTEAGGKTTVKSLDLGAITPYGVDGQLATNCNTIVYSSRYGGYYTDGGYFYTRVDDLYNLTLDQMGQSKLPFDVEAAELFQ